MRRYFNIRFCYGARTTTIASAPPRPLHQIFFNFSGAVRVPDCFDAFGVCITAQSVTFSATAPRIPGEYVTATAASSSRLLWCGR